MLSDSALVYVVVFTFGGGLAFHRKHAVAGPVNIHSSVQQAMDRPAQNHRDPWFNPFFSSILEDCKMLFGTTEGTTFIYPGTGTGGWEVGLTNTLSPGDKILTFRYGQFSLLWVDMMERLGLDVQVLDERWGNGVDEARLEKVAVITDNNQHACKRST